MITVEELFELFIDAAYRGSSHTLQLSDEDVAYNLFEEFDIGVTSFFHDENLTKLQMAGFIDELMKNEARAARRQWLEIEEAQRNTATARVSEKFRRVFQHCDAILLHAGQRVDENETAR